MAAPASSMMTEDRLAGNRVRHRGDVLWPSPGVRAMLIVEPRNVPRPGRTTMARIDRTTMFTWPDELGTAYHYPAAHGQDPVTAYLPPLYLDNHGVMGVFAAPVDAVREILPSDDLHPVRLDRRRAAIGVAAFLYERWWCRVDGHGVVQGEPYGEVTVAPLCTFGSPAPPMLPLLGLPLPPRWRMGMFVQHMPVMYWVAMEAGRKIANFPKFIVDMDVVQDAEGTTCRIEEHGRDLLEISVGRAGTVRSLERPLLAYTVREGRLLRSEMPTLAAALVTRQPGTARLELGDHPLADGLRSLGVEQRSVGAYSYLSFSIRLEAPVDVGPGRPHDGYRGEGREHGRLTLSTFGSDPVDVYASRTTTPRSEGDRGLTAPATG
jgi:hypothetical protein